MNKNVGNISSEKELERIFLSLFRQLPFPVSLAKLPDGVFVEVSDAWVQFFGISRNEAVGKNSVELGLNLNPALREAILYELQKDRSSHHKEFDIKARDGAIRFCIVEVDLVSICGIDYIHTVIQDISERKKYEQALIESELNARVILEASPVPLGIVDMEGNIKYLNKSFVEHFGYSIEEIPTLSDWLVFAYPEENYRKLALEKWQSNYQEAKSSGESFKPIEVNICCKDKSIKTIIVGVEILHVGNTESMLTSFFDISQSKLALEQLNKSETFLRLSQDVGGIGSWEADLINNKQQWSDTYLEMLGFPLNKDPTWEDFLTLIHPDDRQRVIDATQAHLDHGTIYDVEFRAINKSGEIHWLRSVGQAERDESGKPIKMRGIGQDVTQQHKDHEALRKSEDRYRKAFETSIDAVNINRLSDGVYLDINQAFINILGYQRDEVIGHSSLELNIWANPSDRNRLIESLQKNSVCRNLEAPFRRKTGQIVWGLMSAAIIVIDGISCILSTTRDITERRLAEEEQRIAAIAFESQEGMFITDANAVILRVNSAFSKITGYAAEEVVGKNPRMLSSGSQDAKFYSSMWDSINRLGYWEGEIFNKRKNGEIYPEKLAITTVKNLSGTVTNYVAALTDITLSREAAEEIQHLAFYDSLTRLPNRRLLMDHLKLAFATSSRTGKTGALLFLDLDNFKTLNDTLGHDVGDQLLVQAAQRIESCLREGDTVARQGGDEFVVMLEGLNENLLEAAAQTETISKKILEEFNRPFQLTGHNYRNTSSIGAALFRNHELGMDELLKQADIAMYQAKKAGRNTLRFFDPEMQASINARAALEDDLHTAINKQQFQLYYQVQVGNSRRPVGAEALIRWKHPEKGMVSPGQFIPLAEETGQILPIGSWVLDTACAQLKSWLHNPQTKDLTLSVNVSAKQFHEANFVSQVQEAVQRHSIDPRLLKLEPTESILLDDIEETVKTMNALKAIGVHFSLDDFGTGFSSLQYLKRLPLDQLKIDQSFVRDLVVDSNDQAIVRTIIAMAQSLNLDVIAEGVETEQQQILLQENGCNHYQGYLFGKPLPIEEFEASLKLE